MPLVEVTMIEGRTPDKIEKLIENVTNATVESLDAPKESVRVIVREVPGTHWGVAGKPKK